MKYTISVNNGDTTKHVDEEALYKLFPNYINKDFFKEPFVEHVLLMPDKQVTITKE